MENEPLQPVTNRKNKREISMPDAMLVYLPMAVLVTFVLLWSGVGLEPISNFSEDVHAFQHGPDRR